MIAVRLPLPLRRYAGGLAQLELAGSTVAECLAELERRFPRLGAEYRDEGGELLPSVSLYVNGQDVRYLSGIHTPVQDSDELTILMPLAGGGATRRGDRGTGRQGEISQS